MTFDKRWLNPLASIPMLIMIVIGGVLTVGIVFVLAVVVTLGGIISWLVWPRKSIMIWLTKPVYEDDSVPNLWVLMHPIRTLKYFTGHLERPTSQDDQTVQEVGPDD